MADTFPQQDMPVLMVTNNIKNWTSLPQQNQNINQTTNSYNIYQRNQIKTLSNNLYDFPHT